MATYVGMTAVSLTGLPGFAIVLPALMLNYVIGMVAAFAGSWAFGLTGRRRNRPWPEPPTRVGPSCPTSPQPTAGGPAFTSRRCNDC
ncbi:hypothetical protein [Paracoccus yeei]|uniref:hypothetical protein n=1 Tax=Paracoccus yeei TaxID=147645 RepID=UPI001DB48FF1|nr:hypothetical protein [Paracoccus yeei]